MILGSSAGALIGLQFVMITLVAEFRITDQQRAGAAFATPTVVHFSARVAGRFCGGPTLSIRRHPN